MMIQSDFIQEIKRIENYYDKEYTQEQLKITYEMLKDWDIGKFRRSINLCLGKCKFLPKIADYKSVETESTINVAETIDFEKVKCNKCNSSGFLRYFRIIDERKYEYACLCDCKNGYNQKNMNGYNLKFANELGV